MKKKTNCTLDELITQICNGVDDSWDTLKKIRYIYIELGLYLEKNEMFFMSISDKLMESYKLSFKEINDIYFDNLEDGSRKNWNKVICRTAAIILSRCLDKIGIDNKMISTTSAFYFLDPAVDDDDEIEIRHVFVNAKMNDNESIFLTLAADLPYIQNNMKTQCFGNLIGYKKIDDEGNEVILYEGDEITDAVEISTDTLKQIDAELGYLDSFVDNAGAIKYDYADLFLDMIRKNMAKNKLYMNTLITDTTLYMRVMNDEILDGKGDIIANTHNAMMNICNYVAEYLESKYRVTEEFSYLDWKDQMEEYLDTLGDDYFRIYFVEPHKLLKYTDKLIDALADYTVMELSDEKDMKKRNAAKNRYFKMLDFVCSQFIPREYLPNNFDPSCDKDDYAKQSYIAHKFYKLFSLVFDCNNSRTSFNDLSYSEQVAIIRIVIPIIFNDIKDKDCFYNRRSACMSCIYNVIRTYTLKIKEDGTYRIIFEIDNSGDPVYFDYNPSSNRLKSITQTKFYFLVRNNIVCSRDLKNKLNIEEVEDKSSSRTK